MSDPQPPRDRAEQERQRHRRYYEEHREQIKTKNRVYAVAHREQVAQRSRQYYELHAEEIRNHSNAYYRANRERILARDTRTREQNREGLRAGYRARYAALRAEMLAAYGGRCECCGETEPTFLTIDHVFGGGSAHRRQVGFGQKFYKYLQALGYPTDQYRLLCMNCNHAIRYGKTCPHQKVVAA